MSALLKWTRRRCCRRRAALRLSGGLRVLQRCLVRGVKPTSQTLNFSVSAGDRSFQARMVGGELLQLFLHARFFTLELLAPLFANFFRMSRTISGNRPFDVFRFQRVINLFRASLQIRLLSLDLAQLLPQIG